MFRDSVINLNVVCYSLFMAGEQKGDTPASKDPRSPDQAPVVKFKAGERTAEVNLVGVNRLFIDMANYNRQFSMSKVMVRSLFGGLDDEDADDGKPAIAKEEEHQKITASALSAIHSDILKKIGLSLETVAGKSLISEGITAAEAEMRININDRNRFVSFLGALEPQLIDTAGIRVGLQALPKVLSQQLFDHYDMKAPSDEAMQLMGGMGGIVAEYKRLGMRRDVERLDIYLTHARQGDLREYLAVERNGLLTDPGNFGPADWQIDADPAPRWERAVEVLRLMRLNPKAKGLYDKVYNHLLKCIQIARHDPRISNYTNREYLEEVLERVHLDLDDMKIQ